MKLKIFLFIIIFNFANFVEPNASKIEILYKIEDEIITNHDLIDEINYISLGRDLSGFSKNELLEISKKSLMREKFKTIELNRYYEINYSENLESENIKYLFENLSKNLDFISIEEFQTYLKLNNIDEQKLKKKLFIENFWNKLIVDIYGKQVKINENRINEKITKLKNQENNTKAYNLSEIVFFEKTKEENDLRLKQIIQKIKNESFEKAAILFSISESAKKSGNIGWINENQISDKILNAIKNLKIEEFSKPIVTSGGNIILKINDLKIIDNEFDEKKEKEKLINFERNRILNEYSLIHLKKVENQIYVEKF